MNHTSFGNLSLANWTIYVNLNPYVTDRFAKMTILTHARSHMHLFFFWLTSVYAVILVWCSSDSRGHCRFKNWSYLISVFHLTKGVILDHAYTQDPSVKTWSHFLPRALKAVKEEAEGRKHSEQMLWNGKSDHFTSHLFCLPVYCCKAGVQRSRCLAKHEGAVPLSLWGWLSLLSLLMHRHDSCLISWSC